MHCSISLLMAMYFLEQSDFRVISYYNPSFSCFLWSIVCKAICNTFIFNMLQIKYQLPTFSFLSSLHYDIHCREQEPLRPRSSDTSPKQGRSFLFLLCFLGRCPRLSCFGLSALLWFPRGQAPR